MKTLNTIQTLSKIGKVLSKISYIFCLIGAIGCAIGLASIPFADRGILNIGGVSIYGLIGIDPNSLYPLMLGAMMICIGQAVTAKFAERYFFHELTAGTPFTVGGANELLHLGILTICVPLGSLILAEIVSGILAGFLNCDDLIKLENEDNVILGIMFIVISVLCRHGAELESDQAKTEMQCGMQ